MKNFFSIDSKFFTFMSKVADIMILNLLFIFSCIPIVTIGASVTALYYVSLKHADGEEPYIAQSYFRSFKENFKQSTILWIIIMMIGLILLMNFNLTASTGGSSSFYMIMIIALVILEMILLYLFPLLSRFNNTIGNTVVNAFLMSIRHFFTTCMMFGTNLFFIYVTIGYPSMIAQICMFWFLFGFALNARIQASFLNGVFKKHLPEEAICSSDSETTLS